MPYAMLSSSVDEDSMGTSMGIFNMFIVIPQIIASEEATSNLDENEMQINLLP
jgi:maltose/moltooligosaccharide transporter